MIDVSDRGRVRVITLQRPERLNAFDAPGYRALADALLGAAGNDALSCAVLTGTGRAFSTGVDLRVLEQPRGSDDLAVEFDRLLDALVAFPKPLLGAANGLAVGFGMTILLHCDLVLVDATARFRAPFTSMHLAPEAGSSWLLPRLVGAQDAAYLLLTGAWIDADEATRIGFAWRTCAAGTVLDATMTIAEELAALPLDSLVATKRVLREGATGTLRDALVREREAMQWLAARRAGVTSTTAEPTG